MPTIKASYGPARWSLPGALCMAAALSSCGGDGSEQYDAGDAADIHVEETAEPDDMTEDPDAGDATEEETLDDPTADVEEEELPCPTFPDVQPIFTRACTACHVGYDTYLAITSRLSAVQLRVEGFHHVYGEDRAAILRWIECGTPP